MRREPRWFDVNGHVSFKVYNLDNEEIDEVAMDVAVDKGITELCKVVSDLSDIDVTIDCDGVEATVTVSVNTVYDLNRDDEWVDEDMLSGVVGKVLDVLRRDGDYDFDYLSSDVGSYEV